MANILGISCYYHDAAAALVKDGVLAAASQEERFTRKKHDASFPVNAIRFVLEESGLKPEDIDWVVFYEKPFVKLERLLKTILATHPFSHELFKTVATNWLGDKLWIVDTIRKELGTPKHKILFSEHHMSHAASAFFCSHFEKAAVLTIDGVGEWTTAAIGVGEGTTLKLLKEIRFPDSLGLFYSAFTAYLGFEVNEGEYKVMGMSGYGRPKYEQEVRRTIRLFEDGSFALNPDYFIFHHSTKKMYSPLLETMLGPARRPGLPFFTGSTPYPSYFGSKSANHEVLCSDNQRYADIAASVQKVTEEAVLGLAKEAARVTGCEYLCMAGGVALNGLANWRVASEGIFKDIYIQPAAGDSGGAIGAALYAYHTLEPNSRRFVMEHPYLGKGYSDDEIQSVLKSRSRAFEYFQNEESLLSCVAEALSQGKIVGWLHGKAEWGPRALGGRSILADPRRGEMKDTVNTKVKFREPYRPFAPSVLAEEAETFFNFSGSGERQPGRFMMYVVPVKENKRTVIPAVTHVDGTSRIQAVPDGAGRYRRLLERFRSMTGVPMLLNTSFNLKGEPIVNSPADALATFDRSGLDMLVLENAVVHCQNN